MWGQPHGHGCGFDQSKLGRYLGDIWADLGVFRRIWADLGSTVRLRGMGTELMGTILIRASGVPRKIVTLLLGSWWP